jgi:cholesterol transport system auxiliary component
MPSIDRLFSSAARRLRLPGNGLAAGLIRRAVPAFAAIVAVGGCTLGTPAAVSDLRYDLGPVSSAPPHTDPLPAVRLFDVRAPRALDSDAILYRLSYVDSHRTAVYAHSHWTMPPALLLTQRLRAALSTQGTVLARGEVPGIALLTVDLDQFEQVFDGEGESHGALTARATLTRGGQLLAQHTFVARAPADMPNAAGGVGALSAASDQFVAQLVAWLGMQSSIAAR